MNFLSRKLWIVGGLSLALGACGAKRVAPSQQYSLGSARAEYRDYTGAKANICEAEPRWLSDELSGVNGLLARFLSSTEQAKDPKAAEYAQQVALLKEASGSLGKVLDVHQANLKAVQSCAFAKSGAFPELTKRGTELVEMSRTRLVEATAVAAVEAAQAKWNEEAPQREQTARQTWCAKNPEIGSTDVYYARKFADGRTEWLFCDGHIVQSVKGGEQNLVSPEGLSAKDKRKVKAPRYYEAARGWPAEEIDTQPDLSGTSAPAQSSSAGGN
jgi:hypothetical protein